MTNSLPPVASSSSNNLLRNSFPSFLHESSSSLSSLLPLRRQKSRNLFCCRRLKEDNVGDGDGVVKEQDLFAGGVDSGEVMFGVEAEMEVVEIDRCLLFFKAGLSGRLER